MHTTIRTARKQVLDLVDAAYDSGWYAGAIEHAHANLGTEHSQSIDKRMAARQALLHSLDVIEQEMEINLMWRKEMERALTGYSVLWEQAISTYPDLEKLMTQEVNENLGNPKD